MTIMTRRATSPTTTPTAIAYVRVSTTGQVEDGVSLDAQRSKIAAWCDVMGYSLAETYADEGISGHSMEKRPGLQAAVDAVCATGGVLVVYSLSRLARNTRETLELGERLNKARADLVSLSEKIDTTSAAGKMVFRMLAVLAEFERDQVSERTTMALAYKKQQGEKLGGRAPYGMVLATDGVHLEPNDAEQRIIALARAYHAEGLSSRKIAARLAEQGLYSRAGTIFAPSAIIAMLA
jgi:DNA invertase Pin-like site-specific DNA recombinase